MSAFLDSIQSSEGKEEGKRRSSDIGRVLRESSQRTPRDNKVQNSNGPLELPYSSSLLLSLRTSSHRSKFLRYQGILRR